MGSAFGGFFPTPIPLVLALLLSTTAIAKVPPSVSFLAREDFPVGHMGNAAYSLLTRRIATADFNGDGKPDLVTANDVSDDVSVLLGNGDGTFKPAVNYPAGSIPCGIQVADFNHDGHADLIVESYDHDTESLSSFSVLLGNGDGTFQAARVTSLPPGNQGFTVGDFNEDGKPDLAVLIPTSQLNVFALAILIGNGDGTFQSAVNHGTGFFPPPEVADLNGDGHLDLILGGGCNGCVFSVLLGNGNGTFQTPIGRQGSNGGLIVVTADINNDGKLDIAEGNSVFLGNGDGTFQSPITIPPKTGAVVVAAGDFNADGNADLVETDAFGLYSLLISKGDGIFDPSSGFRVPPQAAFYDVAPAAIADFNGDGHLDVALALPLSGTDPTVPSLVSVVLGRGDGTLLVPSEIRAVAATSHVTSRGFVGLGDFNGDGIPDLMGIYADTAVEEPTVAGVVLSNGNGSFGDPLITGLGVSVPPDFAAAADLNHDGRIDLVLSDAAYMETILGNGDGTFQSPVIYQPEAASNVVLSDVNGDGNVDIIAAPDVWLGKGDGTFAFLYSFNPGGVAAVGDFNKDGKLDIAVAAGSIAILLGNGDGTFQSAVNYAADGAGYVAVGDFNNDGNLDLVSANSGPDNVSVLLGNGDGTFGPAVNIPVGKAPSFVGVADLNGDGKADVVTLNPWGSASVLLGNGDGTFENGGLLGASCCTLAIADFNGDGSLDLATPSPKGMSILFNQPLGAAAVLSSRLLTFGNEDVGTSSSPQTVTLRNSGQSALIVSSVTTTGTQSDDFSVIYACGHNVAPGNNCTITIVFTPSGPGARSATLSIVDNTPTSPHAVALSGTATSTLGLRGQSTSATVQAGGTAVYMLSIGGAGFTGTATLACAGSPVGAKCTFPGGSTVNVNGNTPTPFNVNVTTTPRTVSRVVPSSLLWQWAIALLGIVMVPNLHRSVRRQPLCRRLRVGSLLLLLALLCSCGGSSNSNSGNSGLGTPAGTYTLTVTATSGSEHQSLPLMLTVQ